MQRPLGNWSETEGWGMRGEIGDDRELRQHSWFIFSSCSKYPDKTALRERVYLAQSSRLQPSLAMGKSGLGLEAASHISHITPQRGTDRSNACLRTALLAFPPCSRLGPPSMGRCHQQWAVSSLVD